MERAMDLKQLRAFLTVAETGNVTRAAESLHLVQPAVSRQLRLLEEDVGIALFERGRQGMILTEAGRALVGYARRALQELERARAEISGTGDEIRGLVTVGLLPSAASLLATPLLQDIAAQHDGIRIRIATGYNATLQGWLEAGDVDLALLYDPKHSESIQTERLVEDMLFVIGGPKKLRRDRPVPLASLEGKPLVLPSAPHGIRTLVDHACAVRGVELQIVAETNDAGVQKSLAASGHCLTILPAVAVAEELMNKTLSAAPLSDPKIGRNIALALSSNRRITKATRCVADSLKRCMRLATQKGTWLEAQWLGRD
jgi:DNA-binding transcriptional LysR family regulator